MSVIPSVVQPPCRHLHRLTRPIQANLRLPPHPRRKQLLRIRNPHLPLASLGPSCSRAEQLALKVVFRVKPELL